MIKKLIQKLLNKTSLDNNEPDKNPTDRLTEEEQKAFHEAFHIANHQASELVLGTPYPIYGMITGIIEDNFNVMTVEVNYNIRMDLILSVTSTEEETEAKREIIKKKAFEPGIFVTEFSKIELPGEYSSDKYPYHGTCQTVIFGKSEENLDNVH